MVGIIGAPCRLGNRIAAILTLLNDPARGVQMMQCILPVDGRRCTRFRWTLHCNRPGRTARPASSRIRRGGAARRPARRGRAEHRHEAVDRHLAHGRGDRTVIRWIGKSGARREFSYADLAQAANRFANVLQGLGVQAGERVFVLIGRLPELYVAVLGALKARCVVTPLFSAFGPEPIATRAEMGDARLLVTTPELYQRKVHGRRSRLSGLKHVIVVGDTAADDTGVQCWDTLIEAASADYAITPTDPESMALLHFTSGTTGRPKGAVHVHAAVLAHMVSGRYALDLHDDDVFWCTADPGWVTGTSHGIIAPLCSGVANVVVEAEFDAETWYAVLEREKVTVWYTAPTAIRMMMKLGADAVRGHDRSATRSSGCGRGCLPTTSSAKSRPRASMRRSSPRSTTRSLSPKPARSNRSTNSSSSY
jgi:acyl-coenzyme A synthetase/AMP-(fatty) acid ligase